MRGRLQQRIKRTMGLCVGTHLRQRGEVRGPDRRKITQDFIKPERGNEGRGYEDAAK